MRLLWKRNDLPQYSHDLSFGDAARDVGVPSDDALAGADDVVGVSGAPVVEVAAPDAGNAGGVSCLRGDEGALALPDVAASEGLDAPANCRSR